jgi:general secretion pathway protein D
MRSFLRSTDQRRIAAVTAATTMTSAFGLAASLSMVALSVVGTPKAAIAADSELSKTLVTMDLRDADLKQAVSMLTQKSQGVNIVIQTIPGKDFARVNVKLNDVPLDRALRTVAASASAVLTEDEGIFYLRPRDENDPFLSPSATAANKAAQETVAAPVVVQAPKQFVSIRLTYMKPSDLKRVLSDTDSLAMYESDLQSQRSATPNVPVMMPEQINNNNLLNSTTKMKEGTTDGTSTIYKGPNPVGSAGTAGQNDPSFAGANQRGFQGGGFQGGGGGFQGGGGGGFQGGGGQPGGQPGNGQNGQQRSLTPAGVDNIISNDADNTLIVQGDAPGIEELRQIIRLLDVAPKQVLIKAEFVRVDLSDADSFGINWQLQPSPNTSASTAVFGSGNSITAIYSSGNAVANLRATLTRSTTNILQAPIISTSNNRQASVFVQDFIPIQQTIQNITPQGQVITNNVTQYITVSNNLIVTPHINGDNSVSLAVSPQIQTSGATTVVGAPRITSQGLSTFRRIANGESMVLGGFITKQENRSRNDVPFLRDLPIIGNLFRSYDRSVNSQEVLIFLTPTIIEDRAQGVIGTSGGSPAPTP